MDLPEISRPKFFQGTYGNYILRKSGSKEGSIHCSIELFTNFSFSQLYFGFLYIRFRKGLS